MNANADANVTQVVLLATGLDTRSYCLPWAEGTHHYELDFPEVLTFKSRCLNTETPACTIHSMEAMPSQKVDDVERVFLVRAKR